MNKIHLIKGVIWTLFILNLLHLTMLLFLPFGGGVVFYKGIFAGIIYNIYPHPSSLNPGLLAFINIVTSVVYFGSLLASLILPFTSKYLALKDRLIWILICTSIPWVLTYLMNIFFHTEV